MKKAHPTLVLLLLLASFAAIGVLSNPTVSPVYASGYEAGVSDAQEGVSRSSPLQKTKTRTVYITRTGEKYHKKSCRYLKSSCIEISLSDALDRGYTACSVCGGG